MRGEDFSRHHDFFGSTLAHSSWQELSAPCSWHDPQGHLCQGQARFAARVHEVTRHGKLQAARKGVAIECGNAGQWHFKKRPILTLKNLMLPSPLLRGHAVSLFEVSPTTKRLLSCTREHHTAKALWVLGKASPQILQLLSHAGIECIGDLGAIQGHQQYMPLLRGDQQRLIAGYGGHFGVEMLC